MFTTHDIVVKLNEHEQHEIDSDAHWQSPSAMVFANGESVQDEDEFNTNDVWWSLATNHLRQALQLHDQFTTIVR